MRGSKHWTTKGGVRLFLWRKAAPVGPAAAAATVSAFAGAGSTIGADNALIDQLLGGVPVTDSA